MSQKPANVVQQIRKATRKRFSADEKIRIVLEGLRGQIPISELCRKENISAYCFAKSRRIVLSCVFISCVFIVSFETEPNTSHTAPQVPATSQFCGMVRR